MALIFVFYDLKKTIATKNVFFLRRIPLCYAYAVVKRYFKIFSFILPIFYCYHLGSEATRLGIICTSPNESLYSISIQ